MKLDFCENQKATGFDRIPNEVLKQNDIMVILHKLFNKFIVSGVLPTVWLKAIITPNYEELLKRSTCAIKLQGNKLIIMCR